MQFEKNRIYTILRLGTLLFQDMIYLGEHEKDLYEFLCQDPMTGKPSNFIAEMIIPIGNIVLMKTDKEKSQIFRVVTPESMAKIRMLKRVRLWSSKL